MKIYHWILPVLLSLIVCFGFNYFSEDGVAYVDLQEVFEEFEMKKELQKDFESRVASEQKLLDEARLSVAGLKLRWESDRGNKLLYDSLTTLWQLSELQEEEHERRIAQMTDEFDTQIHDQLSQYLDDFGGARKVKLLMGVMDNGTVLHSDTAIDLTKDAIEYVNEKYLDK
jgi:Skp family chaperone for outer membrane proteins